MASSRCHDGSSDREAAANEANTGAKVPAAGAAGSLKWKLRTSHSEATFLGEERGGSSVSSEDEDTASDPVGSGDQSEPAAEVSGEDDDGEDSSDKASANAVEVDTDASGSSSRRRGSKLTKPSNPRSF